MIVVRSIERCSRRAFREDVALLDDYLPTLHAMLPRVAGVRRAGAASLDLAFVACGRLDGFWEYGLHAWDIAAGALLVTEAGGIVTQPDGSENPTSCGDVLAAAPRIHRDIAQLLSNAGR